MTAVVAFGGFIAITANPHNESFPESLQEISLFVTALFNLAMTAFVSVLFFVLGHGVYVVILWVLSGFIKQMSFHPMQYNPFDKNDLWCESAASRLAGEVDNDVVKQATRLLSTGNMGQQVRGYFLRTVDSHYPT